MKAAEYIQTVERAREELRRNLITRISEACEKFEQETGLTPSDIEVKMSDITTKASAIRRFTCTGVDITLEITGKRIMERL